jgi:hypothetical protein
MSTKSSFPLAAMFMGLVFATGGNDALSDELRQSGPKTTFVIEDAEKFDAIRSGRWRLSGVLEVHFGGRIVPHEREQFLRVVRW